MESLKNFLLLGPGPSSSHTIGPYRITQDFLSLIKDKEVTFIEVELFGSLALTGRGHLTDKIIEKKLLEEGYRNKIIFNIHKRILPHPNTMELRAYKEDKLVFSERYMSIGGGSIKKVKNKKDKPVELYPFTCCDEMKDYMSEQHIDDIYEVVEKFEDKDILDFAIDLLKNSFNTIEKSLQYEGFLPGKLHVECIAKYIYKKASQHDNPYDKKQLLISSYAYATSEANARGELIVTTPTCGASGVVPAILYYAYKDEEYPIEEIAKAFLVGALFCTFIKRNASVSGAVHGCQAEVGSATSFAAAAYSYLKGLKTRQIEYAAEIAMEHFLGLTCDPVDGYVIIPCIERNGIAALHAMASYLYAKDISHFKESQISFDMVIETMRETGSQLPTTLKETSLGGLAISYKKHKKKRKAKYDLGV